MGGAESEFLVARHNRVIINVIRLMHKSLSLLLLCLLGCNASSQNDGDRSPQDATASSARDQDAVPSIFAAPRPNSGEFSIEEATAQLSQFLQRSKPIQKTDAIVTQWKSPTQGIRIHVTADDEVQIVDYLGRNLTGMESIDEALDSTMTLGNERSVLLTSDVAGWESPAKKKIIDTLFQPSVQIYLVGNNDG